MSRAAALLAAVLLAGCSTHTFRVGEPIEALAVDEDGTIAAASRERVHVLGPDLAPRHSRPLPASHTIGALGLDRGEPVALVRSQTGAAIARWRDGALELTPSEEMFLVAGVELAGEIACVASVRAAAPIEILAVARTGIAVSSRQGVVLVSHAGEVLRALPRGEVAPRPDARWPISKLARLVSRVPRAIKKANANRLWKKSPGRMPPLRLAFSRSGERLVEAGPDARARVWDVASGTLVASWDLPDTVVHLAFAPGGDLVATAEAGASSVSLWSVARRGLVAELETDERVDALAFGPRGVVVAMKRELVLLELPEDERE